MIKFTSLEKKPHFPSLLSLNLDVLGHLVVVSFVPLVLRLMFVKVK